MTLTDAASAGPPCRRMDRLYREVQRSLALEGVVRAEIVESGPITFARFMDLALYHEPLGYYRALPDATTRAGDYVTAPETHPAFGGFIARFAAACARELADAAFTVVEQGAGTGALADSFTSWWRQAASDVPMRYVIVEPYGPARERLRVRLGPSVDVVAAIGDAAPFTGVYLTNELPDAFPVHRVRNLRGELAEVCVALDGERLVESVGPPSTPALQRWLDDVGLRLAEGQEIEVNLALEPWLGGVASALQGGWVVTIDYGYEASDVDHHPRGTLLAHYRQGANEEFLARIGMQDLTAHVCWTAHERFGERAGLRVVERTTQREFLTRWGWKEYARERMGAKGVTPAELDALDRLGRVEGGLGGLNVLVQKARG